MRPLFLRDEALRQLLCSLGFEEAEKVIDWGSNAEAKRRGLPGGFWGLDSCCLKHDTREKDCGLADTR